MQRGVFDRGRAVLTSTAPFGLLRATREVPVEGLLEATFNGWAIGSWIVSSVHSHFRTNVVDVHVPDHEASLRANLEAGLLTAIAMDRLLLRVPIFGEVIRNGLPQVDSDAVRGTKKKSAAK